jgi:hypothetical protein
VKSASVQAANSMNSVEKLQSVLNWLKAGVSCLARGKALPCSLKIWNDEI